MIAFHGQNFSNFILCTLNIVIIDTYRDTIYVFIFKAEKRKEKKNYVRHTAPGEHKFSTLTQ